MTPPLSPLSNATPSVIVVTLIRSLRENNERRVFKQLMLLVPGLQERLFSGSDKNMMDMAELVRRTWGFALRSKHLPTVRTPRCSEV